MLSNLSDAAILRIIIGSVFVCIIIYILLSSRRHSRPLSTPAVRIDPEMHSDPEQDAEYDGAALLQAGDTARYDANCPHAIRAPDGRAMAFLIVENS